QVIFPFIIVSLRVSLPGASACVRKLDNQHDLQVQLHVSHQRSEQVAAVQALGGRECPGDSIQPASAGSREERDLDGAREIERRSSGASGSAGRRGAVNPTFERRRDAPPFMPWFQRPAGREEFRWSVDGPGHGCCRIISAEVLP
ncbi:MAG TPA: hypothetical protein VFY63_04510, partial [Pseudorhizobium sp.]|nr:hypothetical protein [Pseudorhizobium sp.]